MKTLESTLNISCDKFIFVFRGICQQLKNVRYRNGVAIMIHVWLTLGHTHSYSPQLRQSKLYLDCYLLRDYLPGRTVCSSSVEPC